MFDVVVLLYVRELVDCVGVAVSVKVAVLVNVAVCVTVLVIVGVLDGE